MFSENFDGLPPLSDNLPASFFGFTSFWGFFITQSLSAEFNLETKAG